MPVCVSTHRDRVDNMGAAAMVEAVVAAAVKNARGNNVTAKTTIVTATIKTTAAAIVTVTTAADGVTGIIETTAKTGITMPEATAITIVAVVAVGVTPVTSR